MNDITVMTVTHTGSRRCGYIAIVGRPNVGKSSLLNSLVGQKISITSRKPQTTRYQINGIKTILDSQFIFLDTPGWGVQLDDSKTRFMKREVYSSLTQADVILMVMDVTGWQTKDDYVLNEIRQFDVPHVLIINKIDKLDNKNNLLPLIKQMQQKSAWAHIVPLSAITADNMTQLVNVLHPLIPQTDWLFQENDLTDKSAEFMLAEILREKIMRSTAKELPYISTVEIDKFQHIKKIYHIHATIWVERVGQKKIIIGEQGRTLKSIGEQARKDMQTLLGGQVYLQTWVKLNKHS